MKNELSGKNIISKKASEQVVAKEAFLEVKVVS